ncbi:MAG: UvrD-helicase domain-containing protein [Aggregatilineales bacterium]|nr:UvrD-helicase domain-containing protein [Bacillota bacterium]
MADYPLTNEQFKVVSHPDGKHARVLAVAGSGKTTTMVHRVKYLVQDKHIAPSNIRVLMFNRAARQDFQQKLSSMGLKRDEQPQVHTFHSFAYQFIEQMRKDGLLPESTTFWLEDKEELVRIILHKAIQNLEQWAKIPPDSVDVAEAEEAIGLWKGSLIPPHRAGYRGNDFLPLVYGEFERLRIERQALTYDDFIPLVIGILESQDSNSTGVVQPG